MYFLGIDIGTTILKAGIFDDKGISISTVSQEYLLEEKSGRGDVEVPQEYYWESLVEAIRKLFYDISRNDVLKVKALSISTHTDTIFSVDRNGKDVRPVIIWLDNRGDKEIKRIRESFDTKKMFGITGQPEPAPMVFGNRIYWIKSNEPGVFNKVYKFMQVMDFILYKLTGEIVGEPTVYNGSYIYDMNKNDYFDPILEFIGVGRDKLPSIMKSGTNLGRIKKEIADTLGLPRDIQIIVGAMDQNCSSIGSGNYEGGIVTETTGTVLAVLTNINKPIFDYSTLIPVYNQIVNDKYCFLPWTPSGGVVLEWFKDNFYSYEKELKSINTDIYNYMSSQAEKVKPGCNGLITLPFFNGVYAPYNNPDARGIFFGLNLSHRKEHFIRSIMESTAFMLNLYINLFKKMGIKIKEMRSVGGGSKSNLWNQIKADITGVEIKTLKNSETSVLGAAIIAAVGIGFYKDFKTACNNMVKFKKSYFPDLKNREIYLEVYKKFLVLYKNNEILFS
jgi:xylulokinase